MLRLINGKVDKLTCPNEDCVNHFWSDVPKRTERFHRHGYYISAQYGLIPRYMCRACGRSFTERTNTSVYHLHFDQYPPEVIGQLFQSGLTPREIATELMITIQMVYTRLRKFFAVVYDPPLEMNFGGHDYFNPSA